MFIAARVNQVFGRDSIGTTLYSFDMGRGVIGTGYVNLLTTQQLINMNAIPAGWKVTSNKIYAPSLDDVKVAIWGAPSLNEVGWSVDLYGGVPTSAAECQTLMAFLIKSLKGSTLVYAGARGSSSSYIDVQLNQNTWQWWKNGGVSGTGYPNPLLATSVAGCNKVEVAVTRP